MNIRWQCAHRSRPSGSGVEFAQGRRQLGQEGTGTAGGAETGMIVGSIGGASA
jgi:hypothetical protein